MRPELERRSEERNILLRFRHRVRVKPLAAASPPPQLSTCLRIAKRMPVSAPGPKPRAESPCLTRGRGKREGREGRRGKGGERREEREGRREKGGERTKDSEAKRDKEGEAADSRSRVAATGQGHSSSSSFSSRRRQQKTPTKNTSPGLVCLQHPSRYTNAFARGRFEARLVMRMPNCSSITTASPSAMSRPLA